MFEACKSEQQTPLREETAAWSPAALRPSSHILPLLPAVLEIKQHKAQRGFAFRFSSLPFSLPPGPPICRDT